MNIIKKIFILTAIITSSISIEALSEFSESNHVAYVSAWKGGTLGENLQEQLKILQETAVQENKYLEIQTIEFQGYAYSNHFTFMGNAYIFYTISDRNGETNPTTTQLAYVSDWMSDFSNEVNDQINTLYNNALIESNYFEVKTIKIIAENGSAFIIYTVSDKNKEINPSITQLATVGALTGGGLHDKLQEKLESLQDFAVLENKSLEIKEVFLPIRFKFAYIIYDITR